MTPLTSAELAAVIDYTVIDESDILYPRAFAPFKLFLKDIGTTRKVLLMLADKGFLTYGAISSYVLDALNSKDSRQDEHLGLTNADVESVADIANRIVSSLVHYTYAVKTDQDYLKITDAGRDVARVMHAIFDLGELLAYFMTKPFGLEPKYETSLEAQLNATLLGHPEWSEKEFFDKHVAWIFSVTAVTSRLFSHMQKMVIRSLLFDKYLRAT